MTEENNQLSFPDTSPSETTDQAYSGDAYEGDIHPIYHQPPVHLDEDTKQIGINGVLAAKEALQQAKDKANDVPQKTNQQLSLDQNEALKDPVAEPMVAFGRFVKPELYDVFGEHDFSALSEAERAWMTPEKIASHLFDPKKTETTLVVDQIGLNAYEYKIIARSPEGLGRSAISRVLGDNDIDDERLAASHRGKEHVLEKRQESMSEHQQGLLTARSELKELIKEVQTPGYAHKTETRMKQLLSAAWQEFQTMLDVVHVQRDWDQPKREHAEAALLSYLTQGPQRSRVANWHTMLDLANNYLNARIHLFRNRIRQVDRQLTS